MRHYTFCFFLMLTLFACQKETPEPAVAPSPAGEEAFTYLALGDSYTIGQSVPAADQWGMQLADLLRKDSVKISNPTTIARTGWTTSELAAAIAAADPEASYDLVSLLIGVNNQYRGQPLASYRTEFSGLLQKAIRLAKGKPGHVLVLSIPDWGATPFGQSRDTRQITAEINAYNEIAREATQQAGATFIDITPLTRDAVADPSYIASDGLHYSGKMHREWALLALPEAKKILQ